MDSAMWWRYHPFLTRREKGVFLWGNAYIHTHSNLLYILSRKNFPRQEEKKLERQTRFSCQPPSEEASRKRFIQFIFSKIWSLLNSISTFGLQCKEKMVKKSNYGRKVSYFYATTFISKKYFISGFLHFYLLNVTMKNWILFY